MATITNVRQRLADIVTEYAATLNPAFAGKTTVHRFIPRQLNAAELPAFLILPADATNRKPASDTKENNRLYLVRCYVASLEHGISNELEEYAESWPDDFSLFMDRKPRLENSDKVPLDEVTESLCETDAGMLSAQYPLNLESAPTYLMIEWRVRVKTKKWGIK